jgi:hypothetical protein
MHMLRRAVTSIPAIAWLVLGLLGLALAVVLSIHDVEYSLPFGAWALLMFGGVGIFVGSLWAMDLHATQRLRERAAHLTADLEAQAQLEMARAIREVNRQISSGALRGQPAAPRPPRGEQDRREEAIPVVVAVVDRFYNQALLQANVWFLASVLAGTVGLAVIVWEIIQATNHPALDTILKTVPGLLTGAVAALFYRQANATRKHAADLLTSTQSDRRAETARQILDTIQDVERREEIAARLVMHLAGGTTAPRAATRARTVGARGSRSPAQSRAADAPAADPDQESGE